MFEFQLTNVCKITLFVLEAASDRLKIIPFEKLLHRGCSFGVLREAPMVAVGSLDKKAHAHRLWAGMDNDGRWQFIDGDVSHGDPRFQFGDHGLRFLLSLDVQHA